MLFHMRRFLIAPKNERANPIRIDLWIFTTGRKENEKGAT